MKPDFLEILDKHNPHSVFMDKKSICQAMNECFDLGKSEGNKEILKWLSEMHHLSNNIDYLIEEWKNQNSNDL